MENKRNIKFILNFMVLGTLLVFPLFSFAYADKTTHPALTDEIVKFFNIHYPDLEINDEGRKLIVQGSIDEDSFGRWMRHYYDPVYNRGITVLKKWQSSKEWSQDTKAQAGITNRPFAGSVRAFYTSEDDYSWDRAIYEYAWGDKDRGLLTLGHILHFIEDATVPPHTRNDIHLVYLDEVFHDRSPYEHWASKFNIENIDVISGLGDRKPVELSTLDEYFDTVASHTNKNFFSKDTIFDEEYSSPTIELIDTEILSNNIEYTFGYFNNGNKKYKITLIDKEFDKTTGEIEKVYFIEDEDNLILTDYWNILSKEAVVNGAGVIKLFFDEVKKELDTKKLALKNRSWFQKAYDKTVAKIFDKTGDIYGSSVKYEDLHLESTVIKSQEAPKEKEILEEVVVEVKEDIEIVQEEIEPEEIIADTEEQKTDIEVEIVVEEKTPMEIYESRITPKNTPFYGGGGGGVKTDESSELAVTQTALDSPVVTSPVSSGLYFATSTITFSGTASSTLIISTDYSSATTTADSSNEWELILTDFSEGTTTIQFTATDSDNLESNPAEISIIVDTVSPSIGSFSILECDNSLKTDSCLSGSTTLNLSWTSTSTDISYYSIVQDNVSVATTTATTSSQTLSNGSTYSMAVVAYDNAGNTATSSSQSVEISTMPIVINEIAWSGTASSSADEWIELYNRTNYTIDLSDVVIVADDGVPYIDLSGTIASGNYYLIERTDDDATSVSADLTDVFSGVGSGSGLSNTVEQLSLIHSLGGQASTTLDSTPTTSSCSNAWCAGSESNYISMERIDADTAGTDSSNWSSNNTYTKNGTDVGGNNINGTPKAQNSVSLLSIGYYCQNETSSYTSGGYYIPASGQCTYLSSSISGNRYGDLYKGTIASSTLVNGSSLGSSADSTQNGDDLTNPVQGEDYFTAIYKNRSGAYNDVTDFRAYFQTGANAPPHLDYGVIEWKYGVAP